MSQNSGIFYSSSSIITQTLGTYFLHSTVKMKAWTSTGAL